MHLANLRKQDNILLITQLRGIAALGVLFFHLICLSNGYFSNATLNYIFRFGKYGVQFFFIISGFVIAHSMIGSGYTIKNFPRFLLKRLIRVEPAYLCMLFITVVFIYIRNISGLGIGDTSLPTWQQILFHIGYLIPFTKYNWLSIVFWTLAIEFQFYIVFSIIFNFYVEKTWFRFVSLISFLVLFEMNNLESNFFYWSPIFLLGINLALLKKSRIKVLEYSIVWFILTAFILVKLGWEISVFSTIPLLLIQQNINIKCKILVFLGDVSYSVYLSHTLIVFAFINIGIRYASSTPQKILIGALAILTTLTFSYFLYKFIEEPTKKYASSIKYHK